MRHIASRRRARLQIGEDERSGASVERRIARNLDGAVNVDDVCHAPAHSLGFAGVEPFNLLFAGHQVRREDDQQLGARVGNGVEPEQPAQDRDVAQVRNTAGELFQVPL
jgi:hypothetical protein